MEPLFVNLRPRSTICKTRATRTHIFHRFIYEGTYCATVYYNLAYLWSVGYNDSPFPCRRYNTGRIARVIYSNTSIILPTQRTKSIARNTPIKYDAMFITVATTDAPSSDSCVDFTTPCYVTSERQKNEDELKKIYTAGKVGYRFERYPHSVNKYWHSLLSIAISEKA